MPNVEGGNDEPNVILNELVEQEISSAKECHQKICEQDDLNASKPTVPTNAECHINGDCVKYENGLPMRSVGELPTEKVDGRQMVEGEASVVLNPESNPSEAV